jgi:hypothetical protein
MVLKAANDMLVHDLHRDFAGMRVCRSPPARLVVD